MIRDTKYLIRILVLFIPLPFFWALFDQQGSRWTLQVLDMDMYLGDYLILPDQVQLINPFLILVLVPFFVFLVYPSVNKLIRFTALRKITCGFVLTGLSFMVCAIVQMEQEKYATPLPIEHEHGLRFINADSCDLNFDIGGMELGVKSNEASELIMLDIDDLVSVQYTDCSGAAQNISDLINAVDFVPEKATEVLVVPNSAAPLVFDMDIEKTEDCKIKLYAINTVGRNVSYTVGGEMYHIQAESKSDEVIMLEGRKETIEIGVQLFPWSVIDDSLDLEIGCSGIYTIVIEDDNTNPAWEITDINANVVSVGWIIPQYVVITCAEILVSITGLEFSYSQAPPSMKSVISAVWLFTVALGNVIVLIIAEARIFEQQSNEFFLFAGLVLAAGVVFAGLAYRYVLVDEAEFADEIIQEQEKARQKALLYKRQKEAKKTGQPINYLEMGEDDFEKPVKM